MEPTQSPVETFTPQPKSNWLIIIISILGVTLLALIIFLYQQNQQLKKQAVRVQVVPTAQVLLPTLQSASPTPKTLSSISIPPDETANWKIYSNTEGGFSLKYPVNFFAYKDPLVPFFVATSTPQGGNGPKFLGQKDLWIEAETLQGANLKSIDEYLTLPGQPIYPANSQKTSIIFGGISGYLIDYSLPISAGDIIKYTIVAITLKGEKIYTISLSSWDKNVLQTNKNVLNQILSTFKFL